MQGGYEFGEEIGKEILCNVWFTGMKLEWNVHSIGIPILMFDSVKQKRISIGNGITINQFRRMLIPSVGQEIVILFLSKIIPMNQTLPYSFTWNVNCWQIYMIQRKLFFSFLF